MSNNLVAAAEFSFAEVDGGRGRSLAFRPAVSVAAAVVGAEIATVS